MNNSFLQSNQWEEFQKSVGRYVLRIDNQLIIKNNLPLGKSYLTCFKPDILDDKIESFLSQVKDIAKDENCIFFHLEPANSQQRTANRQQQIANSEPRTANSQQRTAKCMQPKQSLILDISKSEEDILSQMHQKTRYNIRLAEKKGVKIRISNDIKDVDLFWELAKDTSSRSEFHFHSKQYYQKMVEILGKKYNILDLIVGEYDNKALVVLIILYYQNQAIYLHGASSNKNRNLMAPYLAQWKAILEAKKRNCKEYDFWGISPLKRESRNSKFEIRNLDHPWNGITKFKLGFAPNGKYIEYPDAQDVVYQKTVYNLYQSYKRVRGR